MKKIILMLFLSLFICGSANACQTCGCTLAKAEICKNCGLEKGSEACCKQLCPNCGELKGSKKCCDPNAPRYEKCGKIAGSPGCCLKPEKTVTN